jgi:hypothetical protein
MVRVYEKLWGCEDTIVLASSYGNMKHPNLNYIAYLLTGSIRLQEIFRDLNNDILAA